MNKRTVLPFVFLVTTLNIITLRLGSSLAPNGYNQISQTLLDPDAKEDILQQRMFLLKPVIILIREKEQENNKH